MAALGRQISWCFVGCVTYSVCDAVGELHDLDRAIVFPPFGSNRIGKFESGLIALVMFVRERDVLQRRMGSVG